MKLVRATVRNYRRIVDKTVDFADGITVVYGPNESGKSTFAEAIRAGLFLKSKVSKTMLDAMRPRTGGTPEVTIVLETDDGRNVTVTKKFSNTSGYTTLSGLGGNPITDESAAEDKLADLLKDGNGPIGGKGADNKFNTRFAHLFIQQRTSAASPFDTLKSSDMDSALATELGKLGAGAVLQSALDKAAADGAEQRYGAFFTSQGAVAKNSELSKAQLEQKNAEVNVANCQKTVDDLSNTMKEIDRLEGMIKDEEKRNGEARTTLDEISRAFNEVDRIQREKDPVVQRIQQLKGERKDLDDAEKEIKRLEEELRRVEGDCKGKNEQHKAFEQNVEDAKERQRNAETVLRESRKKEQAEQNDKDKASAQLELLNALAKKRELGKRRQELTSLQNKLDALKKDKSMLPNLTSAIVGVIRSKMQNASEKKAALDALSATICVEQADAQVSVNGKSMVPGDSVQLDNDAEIVVGGTRIFLGLGGKDGLAGARGELENATRELEECLRNAGCKDIDDVNDSRDKIQALDIQIKHCEESIRKADSRQLGNEEDQNRRDIGSARKKCRLFNPGDPSEADRPRLLAQQELSDARLGDLRKEIRLRESDADKAKSEYDGALTAEKRDKEELDGLRQQSRDISVRIESLRNIHGADDVRASHHDDLEREISEKENMVEAWNAKIQEQDPDGDIKTRKSESENILKSSDGRLAELRNALTGQKSTLLAHTGGNGNPYGDLLNARTRNDAAIANVSRIQKDADAAKLLHETFLEVFSEIDRNLSAPLEAAVRPYLGAVFGKAADGEASIANLQNATGTQLRLKRSDNQDGFALEDLSGGTQEQFAVAMKLAMAEILAKEHGGHLPVVLDDAFVNSDPGRLAGINRMLRLASNQGLQVIVLSCSGHDYDSISTTLVNFP